MTRHRLYRFLKDRAVPILLWALFVARGMVYLGVTPVWEGFDEHQHYAYVQQVAEFGRFPVFGRDAVSREVEGSLRLLPLPWELKDAGLGLTHDDYWRLTDGERRDLQRRLAEIPSGARRQPGGADNPHLRLYEAQQPPLYYLLAAGPYLLFQSAGLVARVTALRLFSLLLASIAVPIVFTAAQRLFRNTVLAAWTTATAIWMPELLIDVVRVGNDALAVLLFSALVGLALAWDSLTLRRCLVLGILLGAGLLTKAFFYPAIPATILLIWVQSRRQGNDWRTTTARIGALLAGAAAVSGWWFARNLAVTGTWTGVMQSVALRGRPALEYLRAIPRVDWANAVDSLLVSHIWFGHWSFLGLRAWIYKLFMVVYLAGAIGLIGWLPPFRRRFESPLPAPAGSLSILANYYGWFWLGLLYHVLLTWLAAGQSSSAGWYLACMMLPETVLLVAGLGRWVPAGWRSRLAAMLCALFVLLDLYGMVFVMIPYYSGQIAHRTAGPAVSAFHLLAMTGGQFREILQRLTMNRPPFLTESVLALLLGLFLILAGSTLVLAGRRIAKRD